MDTTQAREHAEKIARLAKMLPELEKLPGHYVSLLAADLNVSVKGWQDFRVIRHHFNGRVKSNGHSIARSDGSYWFHYALDGDLRLCINVDLVQEGATCRRVKIGETEPQPIYRIECD